MGRGKSANVTTEFLDEQKTRIITELEKYMKEDEVFTVDISGLISKAGGVPPAPGQRNYSNTLFSKVVMANEPSTVSNVPNIGKAVLPLNKFLQSWMKENEFYRLTDTDTEAITRVIEMFKSQGRTPSWSLDLDYIRNDRKLARFNLANVEDDEVSNRYTHALSELGNMFKPYVDVLNSVFSTRTVNRRKRPSYGVLDNLADNMIEAKMNKLDAYKEFSSLLTQVEGALASIGKLIATPPQLTSLTTDLNAVTNQAPTQDSKKNLQLD